MTLWRIWRGYDHPNARFIQHHARQNVRMFGTPVLVHRYAGPVEREASGAEFPLWDSWDEKDDATLPDHAAKGGSTELDIQDLLFLENRDRKYDRNVYEVWGHYRLDSPQFDLTQFGIMTSADNPEITFALSELVDVVGRPLMPGDVLELPHRRQADLDPNTPPIDRYYVVEDAFRPGSGWDPHWLPHLWSCRCRPVNDQQEFYEVLSRRWTNAEGLPEDVTVLEIASLSNGELVLTDAIREEGARTWPFWYSQHGHFYVYREWIDSGEHLRLVCVYGDGEPPNGAGPVTKGTSFPIDAKDGDWVLRIDYNPPALFERSGGKWIWREYDYRRDWTPATDALTTHINERGTIRHEGTKTDIPKRQSPAKALMPPRRRRKGVSPDL